MFRMCLGGSDQHSKNVVFEPVASPKREVQSPIKTTASPIKPNKLEPPKEHNTTLVLLEIVGAMGLAFVDQQHNNKLNHPLSFLQEQHDMNPYCVVLVAGKQVHRTAEIEHDTSPIWTLKTKSLCLLALEKTNNHQGVTVQLYNATKVVGSVLRVGSYLIGQVQVSYPQLVSGKGERVQFSMVAEQPLVNLALRFRPATRSDVMFLQHLPDYSHFHNKTTTTSAGHAVDVEFKNVVHKSVLKKNETTVFEVLDPTTHENKETKRRSKAFRVWPFPDPDRPKETEFMTKQQLKDEALLPSKQWLEGGHGDFGTVHVEILGCDNLPNMDMAMVSGLTDAFCAITFEDTFVRTSIIHDSLNPRWMPWSYRAFMFQIRHPASFLILGVFDFDKGPLDKHDPIGRVVIHLNNFDPDTVYTLTYPLYNGDTQEEEHQGTITIRLRIQWNNQNEALKATSYLVPPRFFINTGSDKSWRILRYMTRGSIDMNEVTIKSVKLYFSEVINYWRKYCFLLDVFTEIILWRGRLHFEFWGKARSIWFPIHSAVLLSAAVIGMERPEFLPSIFFYGIAYGLLWNNYYASSHPLPWKRVPAYHQTIRLILFGSSKSRMSIAPEIGAEEADLRRRLDLYKQYRVTGFIYEILMIALQVYRVYSKNTPVDISTVKSSGSLFSKLYVNYLNYVHTILRLLCRNIRVLRNFVNWNSNSTFKVASNSLLIATFWWFFPFKKWVFWILRIVTWTCLGPWVKLLDVFWINQYYRTKEELLRDGLPEGPNDVEEMQKQIAQRPNILDPMLKSEWVQSMAVSGRIVSEDNIKLRDFREERYGKWSERVPAVDASRFPSVPLSNSFAQPYTAGGGEDVQGGDYQDLPMESQKWNYVPGQKLEGRMIPQVSHRATQSANLVDCAELEEPSAST